MVNKPLELLLDARDKRAGLRKMIALSNMPSVSLNLNVPGFPKSNPVTKRFFSLCFRDLQYFLRANLIPIKDDSALHQEDPAGEFYLAPVQSTPMSAIAIKQVCESFEEKHPLGRFLDVDVTDALGNPVSSGKAKLCFFCNQKPADVCRHENTHDPDDVRQFMFSRMEEFCIRYREDEICRRISSFALKAVLYEISLTPKPGLVDRVSNGSHADMYYRTFLDSTASISAYFSDLVRAGFAFHENDPARALPVIRNIGLKMEDAMFAGTRNVNTQKGLIFLMGISLFASGYLFARQDQFEIPRFREIVREICRDLVTREFRNPAAGRKSHGELVYDRFAFPGARGEAENGFPMVFDHGLPELLKCGKLNDEALQKAFLAIAAQNRDTNIVYRRNPQVLDNFRKLSARALSHFCSKNYNRLADYCLLESISPGGSADLLVVTVFVYQLVQNHESDANNPTWNP